MIKPIIINSSFGSSLSESMKKEGYKPAGYTKDGFPMVKNGIKFFVLSVDFDKYGRRFYSLERAKKSDIDSKTDALPEL